MRKILFRARRSSILQNLILFLFSVISGFFATAAVIARVMIYFGMEYEPVMGMSNFIEWLNYQYDETKYAYMFFMALRPVLQELVSDSEFYLWVVAPIVVTLMAMMFLYLLITAGYHKNEEKPCPRGLEKIPSDLLLPGFAVLFLLTAMFLCRVVSEGWIFQIWIQVGLGFALASILVAETLIFLRIIVAKLRTGRLLSDSLIARIFHMIGVCIHRIPFVWKGALVWGGCLAVLYFIIIQLHYRTSFYGDMGFFLIWTFLVFVLFLLGIWIILQMNLVRKKANKMALGNIEEEKGALEREKANWELPVLSSFQNCLEDLDRISDGMNVMVEEKMKSERFQTELITNVSHDIKTPLTSIINYLDFLAQEEKKENRNPVVVQEYMEVLERQSVRLKKLIEDLIEVSKASTGSLNIRMEPCELGIFLQQLAGEYEEKLEQADLNLNLSIPEKSIYVEVDGRYLWRVLDNLLHNVCKYAMAGTRVYLQLQEREGQAIISMKNISATELNIPASELMERFVRGDRSRHTEGSGLGLSIAKSLTEIQGGKFAIEIDGDLFKTTVGLPVIPMPQKTDDQESKGSSEVISETMSETVPKSTAEPCYELSSTSYGK